MYMCGLNDSKVEEDDGEEDEEIIRPRFKSILH